MLILGYRRSYNPSSSADKIGAIKTTKKKKNTYHKRLILPKVPKTGKA